MPELPGTRVEPFRTCTAKHVLVSHVLKTSVLAAPILGLVSYGGCSRYPGCPQVAQLAMREQA